MSAPNASDDGTSTNTTTGEGRRASPARGVLSVDDSPFARFAITRALERAGAVAYVFASAADARAALPALRALVDRALLDVELGDGDGVALAAEIEGALPGVAVAFLTGGADAALLEAARRRGPVFSKTLEFERAIAWAAAPAAQTLR